MGKQHEALFAAKLAGSSGGGGGGGTSDYTQLTNKPRINGVTLTGDKSTSDLGISETWTGTAAEYAAAAATMPAGTPVLITDDTDIDSTPTQGSTNPVTSDGIYTALNGKVDKVTGKQLSTEDYTTAEKNKLSGLTNDYANHTNKPSINNVTLSGNKTSSDLGLQTAITPSNKLSADLVSDVNTTNKFMTAAEKTKLSGIETGANKTIVDGALDAGSANPIANSAVANRCTALQESIMDAEDQIAIKEAKADHVIISKSAFDALVSKTAKLYYVYADPVVNSSQSLSLNMSSSTDIEPSEEAMTEDSGEVPADDSSER